MRALRAVVTIVSFAPFVAACSTIGGLDDLSVDPCAADACAPAGDDGVETRDDAGDVADETTPDGMLDPDAPIDTDASDDAADALVPDTPVTCKATPTAMAPAFTLARRAATRGRRSRALARGAHCARLGA